ncbi:MAG: IS110 family transposase [Desulfosarcina sp.]|nr:IS110 family transposase [Desulfosarcina sp.]
MDDIARFEWFCKLRSQIRGSGSHLIVGIDIAKDKNHAFFGTAKGQSLWRRLIFTNDLMGFKRLIEQVDTLLAQHNLESTVFGLEPTSNYHKPLAHWLTENGYLVVLVAGKAVKDNRELLDGRWDKNDTKDSANVADLISQGKCLFYENPEADMLALRHLLSVRRQLKKETHRLRMRIRNGLLAKYFPEMDRHWGSCMAENLAIVRWYIDPRKIAATDFDVFVRHVTTTDRGVRQINRLRKIHTAAGRSIGLPVDDAAEYEAEMLVERFKAVENELGQVMEQIHTVCRKLPSYKLLLTIPGFGPYIAPLVLSTLANPMRFKSRKQVIRLAGLDLNANRSGKKSQEKVPVISKRGDAELRYGLYQAALIASYRNDAFRRIFNRMLEGRQGERGIRTKARVKIAAKMLVIAWTMLKKNEPFNPNYLSAEPVLAR